jgi:hypothetical protein
MKRSHKTFFVGAPPSAEAVFAQAPAGNHPWESAPNFLKFPSNLYIGEGAGVAANSRGHIFVYTRSLHAEAGEPSAGVRPEGKVADGVAIAAKLAAFRFAFALC